MRNPCPILAGPIPTVAGLSLSVATRKSYVLPSKLLKIMCLDLLSLSSFSKLVEGYSVMMIGHKYNDAQMELIFTDQIRCMPTRHSKSVHVGLSGLKCVLLQIFCYIIFSLNSYILPKIMQCC